MWKRRKNQKPTGKVLESPKLAEDAKLLAKHQFEIEQLQSLYNKDITRFSMGVIEAIDAMDRVFVQIRQSEDVDNPRLKAWVGNFRTIRRLLERALSDQQILPFDSPSDEVDPEKHQIIDMVEDDQKPDGSIVEVLKAGYAWHDRILRKAYVVVSRSNSENVEPAAKDESANDDSACVVSKSVDAAGVDAILHAATTEVTVGMNSTGPTSQLPLEALAQVESGDTTPEVTEAQDQAATDLATPNDSGSNDSGQNDSRPNDTGPNDSRPKSSA